jgi:hypothetical protein
MTRSLPPGVRQHNTHEELVGLAKSPVAPSSGRILDAIIVPASRPALHLDHAITLARAAQCRLVVLCSRQARAGEVSQLLASRSFGQGAVIDIPPGYGHRWLEFATSRPEEIGRLPVACATRDTDLSTKRNLGLLLARILGWDRVFFMDDDIRDITLPDLHRTASMLGRQYYSVGMRVSCFPDNSVVCHAHRETGESQDVFVSGSVLAIDCTAPIGFFPDIYNEDWLFFYNDAVERRLACSGLHATQLAYDPFDDPRRAAGQEFGDVLAEGLYALLHNHRNAAFATRDYWADFLEARRKFLYAITARADKARPEVRQKMLASVAAARKCSAQIEPSLCAHYVRLWRKDLGYWEQTLKETPRLSCVTEALSQLGLVPTAEGAGNDGDRRSVATTTPRKVGMDIPAAPDQPMTSEPARISTAAMLNPSDDRTDLVRLAAQANVHHMERLRRTIARSANRAASIPASQRRKLAAASHASQGKKLAAVSTVGALALFGTLLLIMAFS